MAFHIFDFNRLSNCDQMSKLIIFRHKLSFAAWLRLILAFANVAIFMTSWLDFIPLFTDGDPVPAPSSPRSRLFANLQMSSFFASHLLRWKQIFCRDDKMIIKILTLLLPHLVRYTCVEQQVTHVWNNKFWLFSDKLTKLCRFLFFILNRSQ